MVWVTRTFAIIPNPFVQIFKFWPSGRTTGGISNRKIEPNNKTGEKDLKPFPPATLPNLTLQQGKFFLYRHHNPPKASSEMVMAASHVSLMDLKRAMVSWKMVLM